MGCANHALGEANNIRFLSFLLSDSQVTKSLLFIYAHLVSVIHSANTIKKVDDKRNAVV